MRLCRTYIKHVFTQVKQVITQVNTSCAAPIHRALLMKQSSHGVAFQEDA